MMRVNLRVKERIGLLSVMMQKGNFITMKAILGLQDRLGFSAAEQEALGMVQEGLMTRWNEAADKPRTFEFNDVELRIVAQSLKDLDSQGALGVEHVGLFETFVDGARKP